MATSRKDVNGRVLRPGETYRRDGRYAYVYTDKYGNRKTEYARTLQELRKKEESITRDALDGIDSYSAKSISLNELFDRYIKTKTSLKNTTRANYIYMYDTYVRQTFGRFQLSEIKYSDVMKFYQELLDSKLKINTLEIIQTILHPTFTMAVRDNIIRSNPCDRVMYDLRKGFDRFDGLRRALTVQQQQAFLSHCRNSRVYWRWYPMFAVLFGTGCRVGEFIGLRWKDVDMERRIISINHTLTDQSTLDDEGRRINVMHVSTPKTASGVRIIPMMDSVYDALVEEKEYQDRFGENTAEVDGMTGFVFQNRNGNVYRPTTINRAIERVRESYNNEESVSAISENRAPILIPHFTCHHMRHTFCTRFCEHEDNIKVIQEIMGHADAQTTLDIYAEVHIDKKVESIQSLSKALNMF